MKQGWEHPSLAHLLLEESYVLDFALHPDRLVFAVDFALGSEHPAFEGARADEAYDFRHGQLIFVGLRSCEWSSGGQVPSRDPDGTMDWDSFYSVTWDGESDSWRIEGGFGLLAFTTSAVDVRLDARRRP